MNTEYLDRIFLRVYLGYPPGFITVGEFNPPSEIDWRWLDPSYTPYTTRGLGQWITQKNEC